MSSVKNNNKATKKEKEGAIGAEANVGMVGVDANAEMVGAEANVSMEPNGQITDFVLERELPISKMEITETNSIEAESPIEQPIKKKKDRSGEYARVYKPVYDPDAEWEPKRYTEEEKLAIADRIINDKSLFNLTVEQIAVKLSISKPTLYKWQRQYPEIRYALTIAQDRLLANTSNIFKENIISRNGERFNGGDYVKFLGLLGVNKRIPALYNEEDEAKALMVIQKALAEGTVCEKYAESCSRIVMSKLEAKKELELLKRIEALESRLADK